MSRSALGFALLCVCASLTSLYADGQTDWFTQNAPLPAIAPTESQKQISSAEQPYTDEEAADIMKRLIAREGDEPLPQFQFNRFTDTQATLIFTAVRAHMDSVHKIFDLRAKEAQANLDKYLVPSTPEAPPTTSRQLSPLQLAILSNLMRPQAPITASPPPPLPMLSASPWIRSVDGNGAIVRLSDGSVWQVNDLDRVHTQVWLQTQRVIVTAGPVYGEALLVNEARSQSVRAKRVH
jgi:hypothetical protein